jgi:hypothetical protein
MSRGRRLNMLEAATTPRRGARRVEARVSRAGHHYQGVLWMEVRRLASSASEASHPLTAGRLRVLRALPIAPAVDIGASDPPYV